MSNRYSIVNALFLGLAVLAASRIVAGGFFKLSILNFILLAIAPSLLILFSRRSLREFGFSLGNYKLGLKYALAILALAFPLMLYGSTLPSFTSYYPLWKGAYMNIDNFIIYEIAICLLMFSNEFFYRGFLLFALDEKTRHSNLISALVYAIMHIGKPALEIPYSFIAGLIFGKIDLKCKSILPSFLIHYIGNIIFDLLIIYFSGITLL